MKTYPITSCCVMSLIILIRILCSRSQEQSDIENCPPFEVTDKLPDLKYFLPQNYSAAEIPYVDNKPLEVQISLDIDQVKDIDPESMTYSVNVVLGTIFRDYRICDSLETAPAIMLHKDWIDYIWKPVPYIENIEDGELIDPGTKYSYVYLQRNKTILIFYRLSLILTCGMDLSLYPHDTQICEISIQSISGYQDRVKLNWKRLSLRNETVLPEFDVINLEKLHLPKTGATGTYSRVLARVHLKRRIGYFMIHIYIPSILIVVMSMISFWMPPEATPARCALPVTSLLTLSTAQSKTSISSVSYIMAIDIWMLACVGFVFATLVEYALVNYALQLEKRAKTTKQKPTSPKSPFFKLGNNSRPSSLLKETSKLSQKKPKPKTKNFLTAAQIDKISSVIFPLLFAIQTVTYFSYFFLMH